MELENLINFLKDVLIKHSSRLNLKNPRNIRRFFDVYSTIHRIDPDDEVLIGVKKTLIKEIDDLPLYNPLKISFGIYHSLLMIFQKASDLYETELKSSAEKKLQIIKNKYLSKKTYPHQNLFLEDILFRKNIIFNRISNLISIELFYYALNYRISKYGKYTIENFNVLNALKQNYYISQQKEFAYYPTFITHIRSIHPSRIHSLEKDFWATQIFKLFSINSIRMNDWNEIINEMIERAEYYIESYKETRELTVNLHSYHSLKILTSLDPHKIANYNKIIMNYERIESSSNLLFEIMDLVKLHWDDIEWVNIQIDENYNTFIQSFLTFFSENNLFPIEVHKILQKFFNDFKNKDSSIISRLVELTEILNKNKEMEDLFYLALICSENNILSLPIEYFSVKNEVNLYIKVLQLVFLKLLLDNFPNLTELLRELFSPYERKIILTNNKKQHFLISEEEIALFLNNYIKKDIPINKKFENKSFKKLLLALKEEFKREDLPKLKQFQSSYLVYPYPVVKVDEKSGNFKGLRLTVFFKDIELQQEIKDIKNYFNIFFNKICNFAQSKYLIREFLEEPHGPQNMMEFLKGLYEDGYKHIIKLDIKSCTDRILFSPLKYLLEKTLPDEFSKLIFDIATKYTIEFEDRRITPSRGIAQGNPLSNELYTYIKLILIMGSLEEVKISHNSIIFLGIGDDILILSQNIHILNKIYPILKENFAVMGWEFDSEKSLLITLSKTIPTSLRELNSKSTFISVGYEIVILNSIMKIYLKSERIFRIKYLFYYDLMRFIQNLANQNRATFTNFIRTAEHFIEDMKEYPLKNCNEFNVLGFLKENYTKISNSLGSSISLRELNEIEDLDKIFSELLETLPFIPPIEPYIPDVIVYTDGAAEPNPGDAGIGIYIPTLNIKEKFYLGYADNNEAEYYALLGALRILDEKKQLGKKIQIFSDSKVLVHHLNGINYIKSKKLKEIRVLIKQYEMKISYSQGSIRYTHILGKFNEEADRLSREAIDDFHKNKGKRFLYKKG
ncbi:MAG: RNase H family protein [Promethearchaeota archaeon]